MTVFYFNLPLEPINKFEIIHKEAMVNPPDNKGLLPTLSMRK